MSYSGTALIALLAHCIMNFDVLRNRHYNHTSPAAKNYRFLFLCIAAFYISDALWGVLYDAHLIAATFADTVLYFAMMAATVFFWTRYVIVYLGEKNLFSKALQYVGLAFLTVTAAALTLNFFTPVMFGFDEDGTYHASNLRYFILILQVILYISSACNVLFTVKRKDRRVRRRHWAIGLFGAAMAVLVIIQVLYPLLPLYSVGWLLGTCILHTFVLEDIKDDRRLELEELLRNRHELDSVKQIAYSDSLTGVKSYNAYTEAMQRTDERILSGELKEFGVAMFDVNGLKQMNDTKGHDAGDDLLKEACRLICTRFKHSPVFRIGGDEFVAILEGEDYRDRDALFAAFEAEAERNVHSRGPVVASGLAVLEPGGGQSFRDVFERADTAMYERKRELKDMIESGQH